MILYFITAMVLFLLAKPITWLYKKKIVPKVVWIVVGLLLLIFWIVILGYRVLVLYTQVPVPSDLLPWLF